MAEDYGVVIVEGGRCRFASMLLEKAEAEALRVKLVEGVYGDGYGDGIPHVVPAETLRELRKTMLKGG